MNDDVLEAYGRQKLDEYTHWVYILQCRNPFRRYSKCSRKAEKRIGREPDWLRSAFEAGRLYYVGQTENLEKRLGQHFQKENSSDFTTLFPPSYVERLVPKYSRNSAEYTESELADAWGDQHNTYVYSR